MQFDKILKLGVAACFTVVLAACSSTGSEPEEAAESEEERMAREAREAEERAAAAQAAQQTRQPTREELREQEMLRQTVFYFDFDSSELPADAREALVYHANQLKSNPNMNVRLEGHADERGTREYNLALGERRAQAVERYMQVQGVSSQQMETVSYGEEMPVNNGSSDEAYAQNRRVELVYE